MPRWWKHKEADDLVTELDKTLEALNGVTPELAALLLQWHAELARLRNEPSVGGGVRVEVAEGGG